MQLLRKILFLLAFVTTFVSHAKNESFNSHQNFHAKTNSYAVRYLSREELKQRIEQGYAARLSNFNKDNFFQELINRDYSKAQIDALVKRKKLPEPSILNELEIALRLHDKIEITKLMKNQELTNAIQGKSNKYKLSLLMLSLQNEYVDDLPQLIKFLGKDTTNNEYSRKDHRFFYDSWLMLLKNMNGPPDKLNKILSIFPFLRQELLETMSLDTRKGLASFGVFISSKQFALWLAQQVDSTQLKKYSLQHSLTNLLDLLKDEINISEVELNTTHHSNNPYQLLTNIERLNQLTVEENTKELLKILTNFPYKKEHVQALSQLTKLSDEAQLLILSWAASVDHQTLFKEMWLKQTNNPKLTRFNLLNYINNAAAPPSWFSTFIDRKVIAKAVNKALSFDCENKLIALPAIIELAEQIPLESNSVQCLIINYPSFEFLEKSWPLVSNLNEVERTALYSQLITTRRGKLQFLIESPIVNFDKQDFIKLVLAKKNSKLIYNYSKLLNMIGANYQLLLDTIEADPAPLNLDYGRNINTDFIEKGLARPWFLKAYCSNIERVSDELRAEKLIMPLIHSNQTCPQGSYADIVEEKGFQNLKERLAKSHLSTPEQLFSLLENEKYFKLHEKLADKNLLFVVDKQGASLYQHLTKLVKNNKTAQFIFRDLLNHYYSKRTEINRLPENWTSFNIARGLAKDSAFDTANKITMLPYSKSNMPKLIEKLNYIDDLHIRQAWLMGLAQHPNFSHIKNNWTLYNNLFNTDSVADSERYLETLSDLGFNLADLNKSSIYFPSCYVIEQYLKHGMPANIKLNKSKTLFDQAVLSKTDKQCLKSIIDKGVEVKTSKKSLLEVYIQNVRLPYQADNNTRQKINLTVDYLKELGFNLNLSDKQQASLLKKMIRKNQILVDILLNNGVDPNIKTDKGKPVLVTAVEFGNISIVNSFLEHGANVNTQFKQEPIIIVAAKRSKEMVQLLLEKGADLCAVDSKNKTAYQYSGNKAIKTEIAKNGGSSCQ